MNWKSLWLKIKTWFDNTFGNGAAITPSNARQTTNSIPAVPDSLHDSPATNAGSPSSTGGPTLPASNEAQPTNTQANGPIIAEPPVVASGGTAEEGFDYSKIDWLGGYRCADKPEKVLTKASVSGGFISFVYVGYSWPVYGDAVPCDALACMFRKINGRFRGGKFDWIRKGGQSRKGIENIEGGYGGHTTPNKGEQVWFMWGRTDGKGRSYAVSCKWG